ncbi:MAG TPA: NAD-dependent epimerase/dehydratase family protein [Acidimicrobiales bacterium]|jgi:UDP-glucose 4-epimerase|nr:NAD-dependent epimerase/dehydratase family protein [Acidimicrobiales bacterium]
MTAKRKGFSGARVLVTGGAGFIGSHVVRSLHADGAEVVVADLKPYRCEDVEAFQVDLRDPGVVAQVVQRGFDGIVHLAASTSVLASVDRPAETFANNVIVTGDLLEQARRCGVGTFVFASTNAVVGPARHFPIHEHTPLAPLTPYGATKAAAEMIMSSYNAMYGVRCVPLRLTNVYGPGMGHKDSVVPRLLKAARAGTTFNVYGDGEQVRDYVYVADVVAAISAALGDARWSGPVVIGAGVATSVLDLAAMVREVTGVDLPLRHVAAKPGEMPKVVVDVSHAATLGWRPATQLPEGLRPVWASWDSGPVAAPGGAGERHPGSVAVSV